MKKGDGFILTQILKFKIIIVLTDTQKLKYVDNIYVDVLYKKNVFNFNQQKLVK
jgi:hypothetical protein